MFSSGTILPVIISVYTDRSYDFEIKQPPMSVLILAALGLTAGSGSPKTEKVGHLSLKQLKEIAKKKMPDLTASTLSAAMRIVAGTARSMGITSDDINDEVN